MSNFLRIHSQLEFLVVWLAFFVIEHNRNADAVEMGPQLRPRVVVSTDIGGTDPDDYQSMVYLLVCADVLELEGLISSPFGGGRKEKILEAISRYEQDFPALKAHSARYPSPEDLRSISKQGATASAPFEGFDRATEGSEWIIQCARRPDPRPLHVLVWGGIEDLAQALHDAPDILPRLRVYYIGGPNKKWAPDAFQYVATHHPTLWIIESNATYRGWFVGGPKDGEWSNSGFVSRYVTPHGALGACFASQLGGVMKMGDAPSVARLLNGSPEAPDQPSWGGSFVRAWERPFARFIRLTTAKDRIELFGILELIIPVGERAPAQVDGSLVLDNQTIKGHADGQGNLCFRLCPRDPKVLRYQLRSNAPALDGQTGEIAAFLPEPVVARHPSPAYPNWWTDNPDPAQAEGIHHGAKTVSRSRMEYLGDFAARMARCSAP